MEHYSNVWTFEIASLPNVPGHYLRKYGEGKQAHFPTRIPEGINISTWARVLGFVYCS